MYEYERGFFESTKALHGQTNLAKRETSLKSQSPTQSVYASGEAFVKVLIVNTFDRDGGAARSARRLHLGLRGIGVDSEMRVLHKKGDDPHTSEADGFLHRHTKETLPLLDAVSLGVYPSRNITHWSNTYLPGSIDKKVKEMDPDVIHLHWINRGMVSPADLRHWKKPIVWTLHDNWPFTGGCHYTVNECTRYQEKCGACPALGSTSEKDLSRFNWNRKHKAWQGLDLHIIGPSEWLTRRAAESSLFKSRPCHNLPNGIDTDMYKPGNQAVARKTFNLPQNKTLLLVVAMNPDSDRNKGGHLALEALQLARKKLNSDEAELVIAGSPEAGTRREGAWTVHHVGVLKEEAEMAELYQAADFQLVPSYYENLSNAIMEACSSGLPCVAFAAGGNGDMIKHNENGFLAEPHKTESLAEGIVSYVTDSDLRKAHGEAARKHILEFSEINMISKKHMEFYQQLLP